MTTGTLRALRRRPMAAVVMPLPTELTTPPVMKMYLAVMYPQSEGAFVVLRLAQDRPTKDDSGFGWEMEDAGSRCQTSEAAICYQHSIRRLRGVNEYSSNGKCQPAGGNRRWNRASYSMSEIRHVIAVVWRACAGRRML